MACTAKSATVRGDASALSTIILGIVVVVVDDIVAALDDIDVVVAVDVASK